ncbi:acyl-CoA dehydrogenase family protein [Frankia gtarii]|uniref:acyl-CoA dehydrogenase family protein n=1 Tax=Frankia gtarii TaxID=2950102 RepID=UPI0021C1AB8E|nr:acyl-CoA dehydrogenase family protein [Frankia gtarii]
MLALLTDEQRMLRDVVRGAAAEMGLSSADLAGADRGRGWAELSAIGVPGLRLRGATGAPAASGVEVMIAAEELGSRLVPLPYLGAAILPVELLALAGAPARVVGPLADGSTRASVLLSADLGTFAARPDEGGFGWDCADAGFALGLVPAAAGWTLARYGVTEVEPLEAADLTRTVAGIAVGERLEEYPLDQDGVDRWLALALTAASADIVGAMRGALAGAVDYSKDRVQFGVPVGSFQAVQHMCAEALVRVEGAASTVKYAAWGVDELAVPEALLAARTGKAYASAAARDVLETVMQVYGGIGQTWEHLAHVYLRRAMLSAQVLGDERHQLAEISHARLGGR